MLLLPPVLGLDPSKAAAAAPGQRLATLTDSHIGRLLRDDCYSHLLEVAVAVMPQQGSSTVAAVEAATEGSSKKKKVKKQKTTDSSEDEEDAAAAKDTDEDDAGGGRDGSSSSRGNSLAEEFYERFLRGRLLPLCCHHCANFVIQAALSAAHKQTAVSRAVALLFLFFWREGSCLAVKESLLPVYVAGRVTLFVFGNSRESTGFKTPTAPQYS